MPRIALIITAFCATACGSPGTRSPVDATLAVEIDAVVATDSHDHDGHGHDGDGHGGDGHDDGQHAGHDGAVGGGADGGGHRHGDDTTAPGCPGSSLKVCMDQADCAVVFAHDACDAEPAPVYAGCVELGAPCTAAETCGRRGTERLLFATACLPEAWTAVDAGAGGCCGGG